MNGFRDKYELAGHSCSRMMFHCEGDSLCAGWGSPYVHTGGGSPVGIDVCSTLMVERVVVGRWVEITQTLEGPFSALSKPIFAL